MYRKPGGAQDDDLTSDAKASQNCRSTKGDKLSQSSSGGDGYGPGAQGLSQLSDLSQLEAREGDPKAGSGHIITMSQLASGVDGLQALETLSQVMPACAVHDLVQSFPTHNSRARPANARLVDSYHVWH